MTLIWILITLSALSTIPGVNLGTGLIVAVVVLFWAIADSGYAAKPH